MWKTKVLETHNTALLPICPLEKTAAPSQAGEEINLHIFFLESQFLEGMSISGLFSFGTQWPFPGDGLIFWRQMNMSCNNPAMLPGGLGRGREFQ